MLRHSPACNRAKELTVETYFARQARRRPFDQRQRDVLIGSLLGDGTLLRTTAGWCFRVHHGLDQEWYVEHKYRMFAAYVRTPPRRSGSACYFRTITHPELAAYRALFYPAHRKIVPVALLRNGLSAQGLAIWFMDDGSADQNGARLNTQSFTLAENLALIEILRTRFGIEARLNRDKEAFRLRIPAAGCERLRAVLRPYLHPRMRYKLGG